MDTDRVNQLVKEIKRLKASVAQRELEIEKMKINNLFLETLFEEIHEEIMIIDQNYIIHDVNKAFLKHYGVDKEEVIGNKCYAVTQKSDGPCDFGKYPCPLVQAKKTGKRIEITQYDRHGQNGPKEMIRIMYPLPSEGKDYRYFLELSREVTVYRNLILKFRASEKKFRAIIDTATDAVLIINENNKIVLFNNAAKKIFGYSRSEVLGKDLDMLIPRQDRDHYRFLKNFLETRSAKAMGKTLSLKALRKGAEEFPVEMGLSRFEMGGNFTFTAIIRDISTQKKLERQLLQSERLAAVGQTVAHVAHEIKNPLMIIGGFSQQIRKSLADDKAVKKLDMISEEVERLEKMVASLGDLTKAYKLAKRSSDINSLALDVMKVMGGMYPRDKYMLKTELSPDLKQISCDPDKIKQVFMNIISNGIEAMENGGTITISTKNRPNSVEIRTRDEGIGIREEDLLRIFEPFYTTRERGSGLGLPISYKIVQAHRGEITAHSMPGQGTTFVIRLPLR